MLHTFNDSIYNRTPLMTAIGFEDLYFSDDFAAVDDRAAAADDYWAYMDGKISGMFYSDDYLTDLLIDLYEKKTADAPVFLYGISMENHSPFNDEKYGGVYDYRPRPQRLTPRRSPRSTAPRRALPVRIRRWESSQTISQTATSRRSSSSSATTGPDWALGRRLGLRRAGHARGGHPRALRHAV
jgi:arylsulfatase A-like enzyme